MSSGNVDLDLVQDFHDDAHRDGIYDKENSHGGKD